MREVLVVPYDREWKSLFKIESQHLSEILKHNVIAIHHIGSTAIPNIYAKPIIDLLVEVKDINKIDGQNEIFKTLGYQTMGEFGIVGRRYFRKDNLLGIRTVQLTKNATDCDRHIREVMEAEAQKQGLKIDKSRLAELQPLAGRNPIKNEALGLKQDKPEHTQYVVIMPIILACLMSFGIVRFIGMGTGNKSLYIFGDVSLVTGMTFLDKAIACKH